MNKTGINTEWIPYYAPGLQLSLAIKKRIQEKPETQVFVLQNHGVIVTADTCDAAQALHEKIETLFKSKLNLPDFEHTVDLRAKDNTTFTFTFTGADNLKLDKVLFPDQAIYLTQDISRIDGGFTLSSAEQKAEGMAETLLAKLYIETESKQANRNTTTLSEEDVSLILNMPSEKYRKMVIQ